MRLCNLPAVTLYFTLSLSLLPVASARNVALLSIFDQIHFGSKAGSMTAGPAQPAQDTRKDEDNPLDNGQLTISDVLPKSRSINIFASLTRDVSTVSARLESMNAIDNTTLLAPLNSVMQNLPRKPWEDRPDDNSEISAARNEDKAAQNLERFVLEHLVPSSPWKAGKEHRIKTLGGQEIWWEESGDKRVIHPGGVLVEGIVGAVGNGEIWSLKGVINYA